MELYANYRFDSRKTANNYKGRLVVQVNTSFFPVFAETRFCFRNCVKSYNIKIKTDSKRHFDKIQGHPTAHFGEYLSPEIFGLNCSEG